MPLYTMENQETSLTVSTHAAEMHHFILKKDNRETLWQGDPAYWSGRNPILFPMVGSTYDKKLHIKGKEYSIGNHGFARHSEFTCLYADQSKVEMELKESPETLEQYPYAFSLKVLYELHQNHVDITYTITNPNDEVLPFNFGLHPAFACPQKEGESFDSYYIEYSNPETFTSGTLSMKNERKIALDPKQLSATITQQHPFSSEVSLTNGSHGVTVNIVGYESVSFWQPENAPFVCIEPWHSHGDDGVQDVPFEKRDGTILLNPHRSYKTATSITIF